MKEFLDSENNRAENRLLGADVKAYVEGNRDKIFWDNIFSEFAPTLKIHFISEGGVQNVEKRIEMIHDHYEIVCLDSDYHRYIVENSKFNKSFIFQTYTYNIENYMCVPKHLNLICKETTLVNEIDFNFSDFLANYSKIIFPFFIYFINYKLNNQVFPYDFNKEIQTNVKCKIENNGKQFIEELNKQIEPLTDFLKTQISDDEFNKTKNYLETLKIIENEVFLYINGHDLKDIVIMVFLKHIVDKLIGNRFKELKNISDVPIREQEINEYRKFLDHKEIVNETDNIKFESAHKKLNTLVRSSYLHCLTNNTIFHINTIKQKITQLSELH